jgi:biopolymer transport protein ExbD
MQRARHRSSRLICGIDGTPFVNVFAVVAVVLLLILMVDAPTFHEYLGLPFVKHSIPMWGAANSDALIVRVNRPGRIFLANEELTADELAAKIRARLNQSAEKQGGEKKVYIRADSGAKYGIVKQVLDATRDAGIEKVGFIVNPR